MMTIKEFVHTALVELAEGINDANKDVYALGAEYAPVLGHKESRVLEKDRFIKKPYEAEIAFDIAVTAMEEKAEGESSKAGIGVMSAIFGAKAGYSFGDENRTVGQNNMVSRIQFTIKASLHHHEPEK